MSEGVLEANGGLPGQYIDGIIDIIGESHNVQTVSYTHLTLPTILLV